MNWYQIVFSFIDYTTRRGLIVRGSSVVNWYQIVFSFIDYTTKPRGVVVQPQLWIGIRLYFRSLTTQHTIGGAASLISCELVSDCIFVHWLHNLKISKVLGVPLWIGIRLYFRSLTTQHNVGGTFNRTVVNWYQIVFSFIDYTTRRVLRLHRRWLWIGIRLYFRSLTTQHRRRHISGS